MKKQQLHAIILALLSAVLYAVSIPISKILLAQAGPTMTASGLYLGAGLGISILYLARKGGSGRKDDHGGTAGSLISTDEGGRTGSREAGNDEGRERRKLSRDDLPFTLGMIVLDIIAPILLMNGVAGTTAANASLLNNFEIVATSAIAFFIFREKISKRMWAALALIALSSFVLSFEGSASLQFSAGSLLVIASAVCWGLENNCTRMLSSKSTYEIVIIKGLCSGTGMLIIAFILGEKFPPLSSLAVTLLLGFAAYGLSIFIYIRAQEVLGAAKTSAFYALSPFIGALLSFLLLKEGLSRRYLAGLLVMLAGSGIAIYDTLRYRHSHIHSHTIYHIHHGRIEKEIITHEHEHTHIGPGMAHHHLHKIM